MNSVNRIHELGKVISRSFCVYTVVRVSQISNVVYFNNSDISVDSKKVSGKGNNIEMWQYEREIGGVGIKFLDMVAQTVNRVHDVVLAMDWEIEKKKLVRSLLTIITFPETVSLAGTLQLASVVVYS